MVPHDFSCRSPGSECRVHCEAGMTLAGYGSSGPTCSDVELFIT